MPDPGSLDRLHDIAVPPPVPWWPPAPGWFVVGGIGLVLLGVLTFTMFMRWRRNAYRRAAMRELDELKSLPEVAVLVKRVALAAFPRDEVASLTGEPWLQFLDRTGGGSRFTQGAGRRLEAGTFHSGAAVSTEDFAAIVIDVRYWIRRHRC